MKVLAKAKFKGIPVYLYDSDGECHGATWYYDIAFGVAYRLHIFIGALLSLLIPGYEEVFKFDIVEIIDKKEFYRIWG